MRYRLATLKYAPANSPDDASLNSELGSSDMRGVFDQVSSMAQLSKDNVSIGMVKSAFGHLLG